MFLHYFSLVMRISAVYDVHITAILSQNNNYYGY